MICVPAGGVTRTHTQIKEEVNVVREERVGMPCVSSDIREGIKVQI